MEWNYSGRKGRDGQKKKIGKANERKGKVKGGKMDKGGRGVPRPHTRQHMRIADSNNNSDNNNIDIYIPTQRRNFKGECSIDHVLSLLSAIINQVKQASFKPTFTASVKDFQVLFKEMSSRQQVPNDTEHAQ